MPDTTDESPESFSLTYKEFPLKHFYALFLSISFAIAGTFAASAQEVTSVVKIISGTVFTVSSGDTISLLGVGIPPSGTYDLKDAAKHLKKIIAGKEVILMPDPAISDPPGGAKPRYVYLLNKEMVNLRMISDGYGAVEMEPAHSLMSSFMKEGGVDGSGGGASSTPPSNSLLNLDVPEAVEDIIDQLLKNHGNSAPSPGGSKSNSDRKGSSESVRCTGTTTKGVQCKLTTKDPSGRCRFHKGK